MKNIQWQSFFQLLRQDKDKIFKHYDYVYMQYRWWKIRVKCSFKNKNSLYPTFFFIFFSTKYRRRLGVARCQDLKSPVQSFYLKWQVFCPVIDFICTTWQPFAHTLSSLQKTCWKHRPIYKLEFSNLHWDILLKWKCNTASVPSHAHLCYLWLNLPFNFLTEKL